MQENDDLVRRVAALENQAQRMQRQLDALQMPGSVPRRMPVQPREGSASAARLRREIKSGAWIGRMGIGLLLIGLALLFKFGIDRGWVTPEVRVIFGAVLAALLIAMGLKLVPRREALAHILLGGGFATFFVTIFAAFQFYELLSYGLALGAMTLTTAGCFTAAVRFQGRVLALVATAGGLGTPFLLNTGEGTALGLALYTCLIVGCAAAIYVHGGWRVLLWTAAVGGYLALRVGWTNLPEAGPLRLVDRVSLQAGFVFCLFATGVLPVLRHLWHRAAPERWPVPALRVKAQLLQRPDLGTAALGAFVMATVSWALWDWPDWGWLGAGSLLLAGYAATYAILRGKGMLSAASAHGVAAALVALIVSSHLADAFWIWYLTLASVAAALHIVARWPGDRPLGRLGIAAALVASVSLAARIGGLDGALPALLHRNALVDLAVLGLLATCAWTLQAPRRRLVYGAVIYAGMLGWLWRDLVALANGQAYVSIAWGACALALFIVGWRLRSDAVRSAGLATLCLVVAKLFIVDLAQLNALWRILLFLGFGALLLLLSYLFPRLWRAARHREVEEAA